MTEKTITCPKCGLQQPASPECRRCGIIFSRIHITKPGPPAPARQKAPIKQTGFFQAMRITILLLVLFGLGFNVWLVKWRVGEWDRSLWVVVHPICRDASP